MSHMMSATRGDDSIYSTPATHLTSVEDISRVSHGARQDDAPVDMSGVAVVYAEIAAFLCVGICYVQLIFKFRRKAHKEGIPTPSVTGGRTRNFFMVLICFANFSRALSLVVQLLQSSGRAPRGIDLWSGALMRSLPSVIFASCYSVLIYFWAQVFHAANLISLPLLRPLFIFMNIAVYSLYAVITVLTLLMHGYNEYRFYSTFLIGVLYIAVSIGFAVYGLKVAHQLSDRSRQLNRRNYIVNRVLILSVACPISFVLRGIFCLTFATGLVQRYYPLSVPRATFDAVIYLSSEWAPSLMMLVFFWPRKHPAVITASGIDVAAPLLRNDYPQPTGLHEQVGRVDYGG